ncbi:hypothetical protein Neosp_007819 [[Neocosmospora] mangrovei]
MPTHTVQQMHDFLRSDSTVPHAAHPPNTETTLEQKWKSLRPLDHRLASESAPASSPTMPSLPISPSPVFTELAKIPNKFHERDAVDKKNKVEEAKADEAKMDEAKGKAAKDAQTKGCLADSWERVERALAQGDEYFFKKYPQLEGPPSEGTCYACVLLKIYEQDGSI